jgi:ABC-type uncharacterized transport system ATPase subunit
MELIGSQADSPESVALRAIGMSKSFGGLKAVDDVSLEIRSGRIHALLGENGAGKSTLISMLCGQYRPDTGAIEVAGRSQHFRGPKDALSAGIGVVHQDFRLVPPFTVTENIVLGTRTRADRRAEQKVQELAESLNFHLPPRARVQDLVVGQQQQTEILKLIFRGMNILILDEPTAVLTPQQSTQLFTALRTLVDDGKSVLFVSHRLGEVAEVADYLTVLRAGRVVADEPVDGLDAKGLARLMVGETSQQDPVRRTVTSVSRETLSGEPLLSVLDGQTAGQGRNSLNGLSLVLRAGEVVGVAGVSGNGQRLLADVVAGTAKLESGRRSTTARTIAYIPEDRLGTGLVGPMPIAANLAMRSYRGPSYSPWWIAPARLRAAARPLITDFKIPASPSTVAGALSGGGQQRVITAREMSRDPDLVVASQPSRGLDVVSAAAVRGRLMRVAESGGAVLVISEDLDELLEMCDRIHVIVAGRFVAEISAEEATRSGLGEIMTGATSGGEAE